MFASVLQGVSLRVVRQSRVLRGLAPLAAWMICLLPLTASAANYSVAPTNLDFGNVTVGSSSVIVVTITNTSGVAQTPTFAGGAPLDGTNFGGSQNCAGTTLAAGGSCQFTYVFHPTTIGVKSTTTTIGIDSENFTITMSGTGISAFSVAPTDLAFGSVAVGDSSSIVVTITNTSGVAQTPSFAGGAPLDGTNFGGSQNCAGTTLAAGGSCQFTYVFHPTTLGAKTTTTAIGIDGENFPITMSGTAISAFSVAPTDLAFGSVAVGDSSPIVVTITNTSGVAQTPSFAGGAPLDGTNFGGSQNCAGTTLAAGGSCQFTYVFHPTTLGAKTTTTAIGIDGENFPITMSGTGVSPFTVAPTDLAFGNVAVGDSSSIVVTITNTSGVAQTPAFAGGAPLDGTNFGGTQNCAGTTLAAGGSCQFTYVFHPTTLGAKTTTTAIGIDGENFAITMSGTGVSPFTVAPTNLAFGNVAVGDSSSIVVTITNTSGVAQTPSFAGGAPLDGTNFGGTQNCAGTTLAAGGSCQFTYVFHPTTSGAKTTTTTIGIDGENFPITMSGTGVSPFTVAPTDLAFGNVAVGDSSSIVVTITNTSAVAQTPSFAGGAPLDGTNFGGTQNCAGTTLAAGGSCQFTYVFHPTTSGAKTTTTTIGIDSENFAITMSGTGVSPFTVVPTNLAFGNVAVGDSSSMAVTITNTSGIPQTPSFTGGAPLDATNFGVSQNCAGVTLAPGGTCTFTYTFHPLTPGSISSSATIGIDGSNVPIALSGAGIAVASVPLLPGSSLAGLAAVLALVGMIVLGRRG